MVHWLLTLNRSLIQLFVIGLCLLIEHWFAQYRSTYDIGIAMYNSGSVNSFFTVLLISRHNNRTLNHILSHVVSGVELAIDF